MEWVILAAFGGFVVGAIVGVVAQWGWSDPPTASRTPQAHRDCTHYMRVWPWVAPVCSRCAERAHEPMA